MPSIDLLPPAALPMIHEPNFYKSLIKIFYSPSGVCFTALIPFNGSQDVTGPVPKIDHHRHAAG